MVALATIAAQHDEKIISLAEQMDALSNPKSNPQSGTKQPHQSWRISRTDSRKLSAQGP
jgi:hypothetical protein